jgi:hypothetical protein
MRGRDRRAQTDPVDPIDALVELPKYAPAPPYEMRSRKKPPPTKKRTTLLDRLVSTAGVDKVTIDLTALEADLDSLRAAD